MTIGNLLIDSYCENLEMEGVEVFKWDAEWKFIRAVNSV